MEDNKEKFRVCVMENDFYKMTSEIKNDLGRVLDLETPTGKGSGTKLKEHLCFLMDQISHSESEMA